MNKYMNRLYRNKKLICFIFILYTAKRPGNVLWTHKSTLLNFLHYGRGHVQVQVYVHVHVDDVFLLHMYFH